jgi:hypothetical protein
VTTNVRPDRSIRPLVACAGSFGVVSLLVTV